MFGSEYFEPEVVTCDALADDGVVELAKPLLPEIFLLAFHDTATNFTTAPALPARKSAVAEHVVIAKEEVGVISGTRLGRADTEFLVEPIRKIPVALSLTLLLQGRLDVNLELFRVAPGAALLFEDFACQLGKLVVWI